MREEFQSLLSRRDLSEEELRRIPARANINNQAVHEFFCRRHGVPLERILKGTHVSPEEFLNEKLWSDPATTRRHDINAAEAFPGFFHHRDAFREGRAFVDVLPNLHIIYFRLMPIRSILAQLDRANAKFNNEYQLSGFNIGRDSAQVMLTPYPYRLAMIVGQECSFVRGVLQANFTLHHIKEADVSERYCSTPLRSLVNGIYRRFGVSYREEAGRVYMDGEEVARRVVLEPYELDGRTIYRVGPETAAEPSASHAAEQTALRIARDVRREGQVLFREGEIYDAPHCLFDLSWRSRGPLAATVNQVRTMVSLQRVTRREMDRHIEHGNRQFFELLEQKQRTIQALESATRQKDAFLTSTAHDLRTPLNGIIGLLENVHRELGNRDSEDGAAADTEGRIGHSVDVALGSARRLSHLVSDILEFSRLRDGETQLARKHVDVVALLRTTIETVRPLLGEKEIDLRLMTPPAPSIRVHGDENRLVQVFFNLLGNAVKFTERGHIHVSCGVLDGMCEVTVADTGIGIPEDARARVFDEYEQGRPEQIRVYGGSGIGLAVVKRIVDLHGGSVTVQSDEGAGSVFTVRLPAAAVSASGANPRPSDVFRSIPAPAAATPAGSAALPSGRAAIWVCEDDAVNREVLHSMIDLEGYGVRSFTRGEELLSALRGDVGRPPVPGKSADEAGVGLPAAILLDVMMPGIGGFETCRRIREHYGLAELPVIMVTARAFPEDLAAGFKAGASDYVAKPVVREELYARLGLHLSLSRTFVARQLHHTRLRLLDSVLALVGVSRGGLPGLSTALPPTASAEGPPMSDQHAVDREAPQLDYPIERVIDQLLASVAQGGSENVRRSGSQRGHEIAELRETLSTLKREHSRLLADLLSRSSQTGDEPHPVGSGDFSAVLEKLFTALSVSSPDGVIVDAARLGLSEREAETVKHVCEGYGNQEIARLLGITENTVKRHVYNTFNKLGVDTRAQLIYKVLST